MSRKFIIKLYDYEIIGIIDGIDLNLDLESEE